MNLHKLCNINNNHTRQDELWSQEQRSNTNIITNHQGHRHHRHETISAPQTKCIIEPVSIPQHIDPHTIEEDGDGEWEKNELVFGPPLCQVHEPQSKGGADMNDDPNSEEHI